MIQEYYDKIKEFGIDPNQYELCLSDCAAKVNHESDLDWQDIVDKYHLNIHYDTLRKASATIFGGAFVSEYLKSKQAEKTNNDTYLNDIRSERHAVRIERQKLFDERTALNRELRNEARAQHNLERMEKMISEKSMKLLPEHDTPTISSGNDMFICISDFHYGSCHDNQFGRYNTEIAARRLREYLDSIIDIQNRHQCEDAYVALLGDLINGEIHFTVQLESRETVVTQIQEASELISQFLYELSKHFRYVYVNSVAGNHSRTSFKDQVLRDNRLDNLVPWYLKASLRHISNISFIDDCNYDATIGRIDIRGNEYLIVHGDWDSFNESGVSKIIMMVGHKPKAIFYGHMHHNSYDEAANDIQMIRSGCFSGSGDDYCVSKRISGYPGQMVSIIDNTGVRCLYPIRLS